MSPHKFVIAGTGRSGSTWIADVLTAAGLPVGHEDVFGARGPVEWPPHLVGDSSLYAAPFLDRWGGLVFHQVRHPLDCIGSLVGWGLPSTPNTQGIGGEFVWEHLGWRSGGQQQVTDSARYWCDWNEMCERGARYVRYRVEDADAVTIHQLMRVAGRDAPVGRVREALAVHRPLDYRAHNDRAPHAIDWSDIPEPERGRVLRQAARYGYEVPE